MLIIDRFEGEDIEYAVVERSEKEKVIEMINVKRNLLPPDAKPGHVLREVNGKYEVDYEETEKRLRLLSEKTKNLWVDPDPSIFKFDPTIYKK